jgi:hypothetical protein
MDDYFLSYARPNSRPINVARLPLVTAAIASCGQASVTTPTTTASWPASPLESGAAKTAQSALNLDALNYCSAPVVVQHELNARRIVTL